MSNSVLSLKAVFVKGGERRAIAVGKYSGNAVRLATLWTKQVNPIIMSPLRRHIFVCFYGKMGVFRP